MKKLKNFIKTLARKVTAFLASPTAYRRVRRAYRVVSLAALVACFAVTPAFAADPLGAINKLSEFVFAIIKAVGIIIAGWGVVQFGMSVQSHDPSQRTQGILCVVGGLLIYFAKDILDLITAGG